jgi:hypothetical protein
MQRSKAGILSRPFKTAQVALDLKVLAGSVHILVSPATAVEHNPRSVWQGWAELLQVGKRMGCLQCRDDALQPRDAFESCM